MQRPVGHQHTPPREQISDLDRRQVLADPLADLLPLGLQRVPGRAVPAGACRPHGRHHLTDHLVSQLPQATFADHTGRLGGDYIAACGLAVHSRLPGHRTQPPTAQPPPQDLTYLNHRNLPKRHLPNHHVA
ncbi:MAG TPA: hypothetical protein VGO16_04450 [Pseudonocardiaceae bacterium]|nr:hypothetical protein [Pseudonocardiaceae bacterium]